MPLQWFVLFDGPAGWKRQARFGRGKVGPERNDGKGLDKASGSARSLSIPRVNNKAGGCVCLSLAAFCEMLFTCLCF